VNESRAGGSVMDVKAYVFIQAQVGKASALLHDLRQLPEVK